MTLETSPPHAADDAPSPPPAPTAPAPAVPPVQPSADAPLNDEQIDQVARAAARAKKLGKAANVAVANGFVLGGFAVGSLMGALVNAMLGEFDALGYVMGVGLAVVAWNEFRGRRKLLHFEPASCRLLGLNQLGLMALIIAYAAWQLGRTYYGPNLYAEAMAAEPELVSRLGSIDRLYRIVSLAMYGGLIAATIIVQGLNSLYYFTRRKHVEEYLAQTPYWVRQLQRSILDA